MEECIQKFIEIDQAWKILGNEETKKEYDLQRHGRYLRRGAQQAGSSVKCSVQPLLGRALQHLHQLITASFLLLPGVVSNYALFLIVITVYPLRS